MAVRSGIAYCAQQPWIRNESLRDNILFGDELDLDWYNTVLNACGLGPDLEQLPYGDQTEIGERGVTISGGQKQRVALARAVYQRSCSLVILDDVFSALDAHTSSHIVSALFKGPQALLRNRAVLMASHHTSCAPEAQRILLLGSVSVQQLKPTKSDIVTRFSWQGKVQCIVGCSTVAHSSYPLETKHEERCQDYCSLQPECVVGCNQRPEGCFSAAVAVLTALRGRLAGAPQASRAAFDPWSCSTAATGPMTTDDLTFPSR